MTQRNASFNLIGALALTLNDLQMDAAVAVSGLSATACACLVSLAHQDTAHTISDTAAICRLSHSATVRLVNKLEDLGYVCRINAEADQREVYVCLTVEGYKVRDAILRARHAAIEPALSAISDADVEFIADAAGTILSEVTGSRLESEQICRLCNAIVCGGDNCPVEKKALKLEAALDS